MPRKYFLLTYSVSPVSDKSKDLADKVRRKISEIDEWTKLSDVETAFAGSLYLISDTEEKRRTEAKKDVTTVFRSVLDELNAYSSVLIYVALLVDGHSPSIEFSI